MVIFGGDYCVRTLGNSFVVIIRCDGGNMMCTDIVSGGIAIFGGCLLVTSIEWSLEL